MSAAWHDTARAEALRLFQAGVAAADPADGVSRALAKRPVAPDAWIVAVGKAAVKMTEAAMDHVPSPRGVIVVTNPENARPLPGAQVFAASHPVPDAEGLRAAEAVEAMLAQTTVGQEVLVLISGGGSALVPAPRAGLSLDDKQRVAELLLGSGADIVQMNLIRQALSRLKGGGLASVAAPARVRSLILSDVVGDEPSAIASGPTVAPLGSVADARQAVQDLGLWDAVPETVRQALMTERGVQAPSDPDLTLIGSNSLSLRAMGDAAPKAILHETPLAGDVADAAARIAEERRPGIHLFGGETTVRLTGTGRGGRNQELALRVALALEGRTSPWVYLQAGTDGRDGPTDAAGGLVDDRTLARIDAPAALLADNDAYAALDQADALLRIGGTGTNVADLGVLILA
ncbi:MAG: glycerate kinase type-2 family protein [Shimia sp.]